MVRMGLSPKARTEHDMILLVTSDVPREWCEVCEEVGWITKDIDHIPYKKELYPEGVGPRDGPHQTLQENMAML